jgi:hypothetical protein
VCAGGEGLVVERQRRHGAKPPDIPTRPRERERERGKAGIRGGVGRQKKRGKGVTAGVVRP